MITTKSGRYVVVDITDPAFCPGKVVPKSFQDAADHGTWFFMPAAWASPAHGYGAPVSRCRGFPFTYSTGFATPEDAVAAAEEWEASDEQRERDQAAAYAACFGGLPLPSP